MGIHLGRAQGNFLKANKIVIIETNSSLGIPNCAVEKKQCRIFIAVAWTSFLRVSSVIDHNLIGMLRLFPLFALASKLSDTKLASSPTVNEKTSRLKPTVAFTFSVSI